MKTFCALTISFFLFFSCKKGDAPPDQPQGSVNRQDSVKVDSLDIHVVGARNGILYYWKNGLEKTLSKTTGADGIANAIGISDTNVYVVGRVGFTAKVWKNGVATNLSDGSFMTHSKSIAISNGDVYIAGFEFSSPRNNIVVWKNGVKSIVATTGEIPDANGIAVAGNDVYVIGSFNERAFCWKNGIAIPLSHPDSLTSTSGIAVSGNDVYISGIENARAVFWKNGVKTILSHQSSLTKGIAVLGSDVYVVGAENWNTAVYWKNGIKTVLGTNINYAHANAISIYKNDVYIAGDIGGFDYYWKNDVRTRMTSYPGVNANSGSAVNILVVKR
ncbi:MAG TPA: hypothetical protein VF609_07900 [Flavisolibacter sp.]|jgi:hypothetical protein